MTISVFYYEPIPQGGYPSDALLAYYFDANSMTVRKPDHPDVVAFLGAGGTIQPYQAPPAPPTAGAIDQTALNDALAADGSVFRGFVLVVLDEINLLRAEIRALKTKAGIAGAVPDRTVSQIKPAIVGKMR